VSEPITVLDLMPIILTKDVTWQPRTPAKEGAIILLPSDAVLVKPKSKNNLKGEK